MNLINYRGYWINLNQIIRLDDIWTNKRSSIITTEQGNKEIEFEIPIEQLASELLDIVKNQELTKEFDRKFEGKLK